TTYPATGLTASTSYSFRVRAVNATGNSGYSNTATTTTLAGGGGGTQTLLAVADAYIRSGAFSATNYGSAPTLIVKRNTNTASDDFNRAAYLKFDLSGVTSAPASATLTLTIDPASDPPDATATLNLYAVSDTSWAENSLSWNNAPGLNAASFVSTGTLLR